MSIPYAEKKTRLLAQLAASPASDAAAIGLNKRTSNLFRDRARPRRAKVDLSHFDETVRVDTAAGVVEVEGMTRYVDFVDALLPHSAMPCVVPQLKSITVGGAVAGVGIEASSFKYGLVHQTITALEVLTGDRRVVVCTADNEYRDLFYGFPNSYGTLGYALKLTARIVPVKRFVQLEHVRYTEPEKCFTDVAGHCAEAKLDFLDGVVFSRDALYLTLGRFVDAAPYTSDYTFERMYYRSIRERSTDFLTVHDFIWRWDTDWFWCSKNVFAQQPLVRRLLGRKRLNSIVYQRIMRWNARWGVTRALNRLRGIHPESVIQDVDVPLDRAAEFLAFMHEEVGILPIWLCPIKAPEASARFALYPLRPATAHINFGFWDVVTDRVPRQTGFYNRKVEGKVAELGGIKSLYSDSYYNEKEFWATYNQPAYMVLKQKYDPDHALGDLYAKCVLRQ